MSTKELIFINVVVIVVVLALLSIFSVNNARNNDSDVIDTLAGLTSGDEVRSEFIIGCMAEDADRAYCECGYDYIADRTTMAEYIKLSVEFVETEVMPDLMWEAVRKCSYLAY